VSNALLELIWQPAVKEGLLGMQDARGNSPLHVAASNNQIDFCNKVFSDKHSSNEFRSVRNAHGQTAAHVATEAKPRRIGPERHHSDKHNSASLKSSNSKSAAHDHMHVDEHGFDLRVLELLWKNEEKGNRDHCLFVPDFYRQTCLHLAAAQGTNVIINFLD